MGRRLPPLNAIRAFEAAARHLSFTRAAEELNVTQAAISHQIKGLEDTLGLPLFRRLNRALVLTEAGQGYLPPLREALDQIADATSKLKAADGGGSLTVSTLASFAAKWLVPRLPRFQERHPSLDVLLSTSSNMVDFTQQDVDVAIRFGRGGWEGVRAEKLLTEDIFPVCAPRLLEGTKPLRTPEDLAGFTLLHDDFLIGWTMWLNSAGVSGVDAARGPRFMTDSALMLQAAIAGHGVALARRVLAADDLDAGRLVAPFGFSLPTNLAYYFVAPPRYFERPKVAAFYEWVCAEARDYRDAEARAGSPAALVNPPGWSV
ncbi:transcriptional regulator [Skermanella stibiiresistens SB22]|uniref:Transcriptional regulator n=2 Tax=Skermanella TaxID=204447 RepID=W9HAW3_9PROT|nr:transcriptional regulator GcvA [Skermanella stibiiresistens]EWY41881.1 transcriptional regulator [Skermanella stibiiresistens SB22]